MIQPESDSSKRVAYFYNYQIGKFHYGKEHPMKPKRIAMAHNLIVNYGMYRMLDVYLMREAQLEEIRHFHDQDYIAYLSQFMSQQKVNFVKEYFNQANDMNPLPEGLLNEYKMIEKAKAPQKAVNSEFRVGDSPDNPTFSGLFTFCQLSAGASIDCAHAILSGEADIAINWAGGLHHAKKKEASGFCYVNDIVVCIVELLRIYTRVLYVDIDCHHGDGVEEAFFLSNRVMTVSFHQYGGDFYPGSGNIDSIGSGQGRYFAVNVPMKPGMSDQPYYEVFRKVMSRVMETFRPDAVVMQCGADSLAYDKLGGFNLSIRGHGACVKYMKGFGVPIIYLGGGGYTIQNVSRCWAYETGLTLGLDIDEAIPAQDKFYDLYYPDYKLHFNIRQNVENKNKDEDLNKTIATVYEHLRQIEQAPGIHFHDVPYSFYPQMEMENEDDFPDEKKEYNLSQFDQNPDSQDIAITPFERKLHQKE